jgi:CMP-N,N'-diacetyllegionaminic acid synthase
MENHRLSAQNVLAIIPARSGSKGLPNKNVLPLAGRPLLAWSIDHAVQAKLVDRVICSTDDEKIAEIAREHGAEAPFLRPAELSGDDANDASFTVHAVKWLAENENWKADIVVILRPTSPIRDPADIDGLVQKMIDNPTAHSCLSVVEAEKTPYKMLTEQVNGSIVPIVMCEIPDQLNAARQTLPRALQQTGAIHGIRGEIAVRDNTVIGAIILPYEPKFKTVIDIDSIEDFAKAEQIIMSNSTAKEQ